MYLFPVSPNALAVLSPVFFLPFHGLSATLLPSTYIKYISLSVYMYKAVLVYLRKEKWI